MTEPTNEPPKRLTLTQKYEAAEKEIETLKSSLTEKDGTIETLNSELETEKTAKTEAVSAKETLETEKGTLQSSYDELKTKFEALETEKVELESKEQDVEKRASARLAAMQAELGSAPPLETQSGEGGGKPDPASKNLTGIERTIAALKELSVSA